MRLVDMQIKSARAKVAVAVSQLRRHLTTAVVLRDGTKCHYCGCETHELMDGHPRRRTIDHVIPQKYGGKDDLDNLVLSCQECNSRKGAKVDRSLLCPKCSGGRTVDAAVAYEVRQ